MLDGKVCFGILGPGKISHRFMKGIAFANNALVLAVASRDFEKAQVYAKQYDIKRVYQYYKTMLEDPDIDIIYIATIPGVHHEQIMMCLDHHKHVLCEKPMLADQDDLRQCFAYAAKQGCFLMEAQKAPFNYLNRVIKKRIDEGLIGDIKYIEASYCYDTFAKRYDHWVFNYEDGGGMFDVGVYAIAYANMMADSKILKVQSMVNRTPTGCDGFAVSMLEYDNGVKALVKGAIELQTENKAMIYGTKGYIETYNFWKNEEATIYLGDQKEILKVPMPSDFFCEIEHAIECVLQNRLQSPIMSETQNLEILKVLDHVKSV